LGVKVPTKEGRCGGVRTRWGGIIEVYRRGEGGIDIQRNGF